MTTINTITKSSRKISKKFVFPYVSTVDKLCICLLEYLPEERIRKTSEEIEVRFKRGKFTYKGRITGILEIPETGTMCYIEFKTKTRDQVLFEPIDRVLFNSEQDKQKLIDSTIKEIVLP